MAASAVLLRIARDFFRIIDFPLLSWNLFKTTFPISFLYCTNAMVALTSLRDLSVASYRLAPIATVVTEYIVLGKTYSLQTCAILVIMVLGAILAGVSDQKSLLDGWIYGVVSCLLQACCLVLVKKSDIEGNLGIFGLLYYHSFFSFFLLLSSFVWTGDINAVFTMLLGLLGRFLFW
eukprot:jgi/Galph1/2079/GphlegSOOS_G769.1